MNLGSSIRKRRFRRRPPETDRGRSGGDHEGRPRRSWLAGLAGAAVVLGLGLGYLVSTRLLFPAVAPPEDLVETPDVQGLTLTEAMETLQAAGLEVGTSDSIRHPTAAQGHVLGQSPLPGQLGAPGTAVDLTYSMGPEARSVPEVLRLRAERARTVLEATGFVVQLDSVESSAFRGTVVGVRPEVGTELPLPAEVTVEVSLGPPMVAMPDLLGLPEEEALEKLKELELLVPEVETRFRFGLDQGTVIEQEPAPEEMVEQGSAVRIVVGRAAGDNRNQ